MSIAIWVFAALPLHAMQSVATRWQSIRARVDAAATRAGSSVTLVAVSKRQPIDLVRQAHSAGCRDFGENYASEMVEKAQQGPDDARWHFIGHLQRNKVKSLLPHAALVHGVDRIALGREINKRAQRTVDVLVQVNVAGEAQKSGCAVADLGRLLEQLRALERVRVCGLMTIPPAVERPQRARPHFAALRKLRDAHGGACELPHLSMGMSQDFEVAIEEGATIVRVGTAIFGPRPA